MILIVAKTLAWYARRTPPKSSWKTFWRLYYVFANQQKDFVNDYCQAQRCKGMNSELLLLVDNGQPLLVPCSTTMNDKTLLGHLHTFYDLVRARGGLFELLGAKSILRIEIVAVSPSLRSCFKDLRSRLMYKKLHTLQSVGHTAGRPLDLGRHGPYNRLVKHFNNPSELKEGTVIVETLKAQNVLCRPAEPITIPATTTENRPSSTTAQRRRPSAATVNLTHALNIIRGWDVYITSLVVILPVAVSFIVSVVWSVVAAVHFKSEAQASVQAGFTIGSYIVTAGQFFYLSA